MARLRLQTTSANAALGNDCQRRMPSSDEMSSRRAPLWKTVEAERFVFVE